MARHEVKGLDTLRFLAASTVALGHGAAPPLTAMLGGASWARLLGGIEGVTFDGLAAVVVFFVISGFCIHYAPATGAPVQPLAFWTRRGLRTLLPMLAAAGVAAALGPAAQGGLAVVIWSVYCELIYYALYPGLRLLFRRFGLERVTLASCVIALALIVVGWRQDYYWAFGVGLAWLVAAPAWLMGCLLAERVAARHAAANPAGPPPPAWRLWGLRASVWAYGVAALVVFFHTPLHAGFPALLFPFQALATLWVLTEIKHFEVAPVSPALEWCGRWSYSLYLVHNIVLQMLPIAPSAAAVSWLERLTLIVGGSLAFYAAVEWPSHWLARTASRWVAVRLTKPATSSPQPAA